ncbi:MAG: 4-hydroxy-tetrahydrodipicolinate reductase [Oscillospiraceae bacterium]
MKTTVGLFGFGRTGSVVANEILKEEAFELKWVMRRSAKNEGEFASRLLGCEYDNGKIFSLCHTDFEHFYENNKVDVIIDFSAACAVGEYAKAAENNTRIVSAISDYEKTDLEKLKELSQKTAVLYSPNITLGINFLIEASKVLQQIAPNADIEIIEEHFREKKGPSGTALRIADDLGLDKDQHVNSIRVGGIVGRHEVVFGLPYQTIRIVHESLSRAAFGQGAIYAAKWLLGKENGIYTMEQALSINVKYNPEL